LSDKTSFEEDHWVAVVFSVHDCDFGSLGVSVEVKLTESLSLLMQYYESSTVVLLMVVSEVSPTCVFVPPASTDP